MFGRGRDCGEETVVYVPSHQTADGRVGINGGKRQSMMSDRRSLSYETQCRQRRVATELQVHDSPVHGDARGRSLSGAREGG